MRVYHDFFWYPDPGQRFLMRIRIRPNDTDPKQWTDETQKGWINLLPRYISIEVNI